MEKQTYHIWDRRHELESLFDAWEVASGPHIFDEVKATSYPKDCVERLAFSPADELLENRFALRAVTRGGSGLDPETGN